MKAFNSIFFITVYFSLTHCTQIEQKPSHVSLNISESRSRSAYINTYKVIRNTIGSKVLFNYDNIWLERMWSNSFDQGQEKTDVSNNSYQLIINFKNEDIFAKNIYWDQYILKDKNGNVMASNKSVLFLNVNQQMANAQSIKLIAYAVKNKFQTNLDTVKIGELIVRRK